MEDGVSNQPRPARAEAVAEQRPTVASVLVGREYAPAATQQTGHLSTDVSEQTHSIASKTS
jgi:hypothetical protein